MAVAIALLNLLTHPHTYPIKPVAVNEVGKQL